MQEVLADVACAPRILQARMFQLLNAHRRVHRLCTFMTGRVWSTLIWLGVLASSSVHLSLSSKIEWLSRLQQYSQAHFRSPLPMGLAALPHYTLEELT